MQRKASKKTRGPNAEEKRYQKWVKDSFFCITCEEDRPVICHHCEGATFRHNKILVGHWFCIGLCEQCDNIITNGSRRDFVKKFGPQSNYWRDSRWDFADETGFFPPQDVFDAIMDWGK